MNTSFRDRLAWAASTVAFRALGGAVTLACPPEAHGSLALVAGALDRLDPGSVEVYRRNALQLGAPAAVAPAMQRARARWLLEMLVERDPEWLRSHVRLEGCEPLLDAAGAGRGAVLLFTHAGVPDLAARALAARGHRVAAAMDRPLGPALWRGVVSRRARLGIRFVPRAGAGAALAAELRRGALTCFAWDGQLGPHGSDPLRGVEGPLLLAARAGAPAFRALCLPVPGGGYQMTVSASMNPGRSREEARALAAEVVRAERAALAADPSNWSLRMEVNWPGSARESARECA